MEVIMKVPYAEWVRAWDRAARNLAEEVGETKQLVKATRVFLDFIKLVENMSEIEAQV